MQTLLLDTALWDLVLDANGNIALASEPYSLAQDAASAIKTFLGEVYYDTSLGVPYLTQILGFNPPLPLLKKLLVNQALTVPGVTAAQCFIQTFTNRTITGQVQVTDSTNQTSVASFAVAAPQGVG